MARCRVFCWQLDTARFTLLCCFLSSLALIAAVSILACVICGIGYGVSLHRLCDTEAEASVADTFFTRKLQDVEGYLPDGKGLCILEISFSFEGSSYNRTLYATCTSCRDFYRHPDSQTLPVCFKGSPAERDVLLPHGKFGTHVTSQSRTQNWRLALAVTGGLAAGSIACIVLSFCLQQCLRSCAHSIGRTKSVIPIAREQEIKEIASKT